MHLNLPCPKLVPAKVQGFFKGAGGGADATHLLHSGKLEPIMFPIHRNLIALYSTFMTTCINTFQHGILLVYVLLFTACAILLL